MRRRRFSGMALVGGMAVILLVVAPAALTPPSALGSDLAGCSELIVNGGFEQGGAGWQQQPSPPLPAGVTLIDPFYPHTPNFGAYLAGRNGANDRLSQQLILPANATSMTLNLWWALFTEETAGAFDHLQVALYEPSTSALIATLLAVDNSSATDWAWNLASFDLTPYAGRTVILRFTATNDIAGSPTTFFADDVSILACTASPTPTPASTASPTASPSATATSTVTATRTPTPTSTASLGTTATSTATATPTPTSTAVPDATATATVTATRMPASTSTPTATQTARPGRRSVYLPLVIRGPG